MTLDKANAKLTRVSIRAKGNRLYLRATLPPKFGNDKPKQYELSTGLPNNTQGIKIALARAQKLESDLNLEKFSWADWLDLPGGGTLLIPDAIKQFEQYYWETRAQTVSRRDNFKTDYLRPFSYLPPDESLTAEVLRRVLVRFPADSRDRVRAYVAFGALARWAKLELGDDWKRLRGEYKAKSDRVIPTDEQIEEIRESIKNPAWQWVFGMLSAYGLRPHEIFHLDCSLLPVLEVKQDTKTRDRLVYPVPGRWVEQWDLYQIKLPNIQIEGKSNKAIGTKISQDFKERKLGIVPYALRDAYAIRCAVVGVDSLIASKWMGHSLSIHQQSYLRFIDKIAMQRIWEKLGK